MTDDWKYLRKELDRVDGRVLDFGSYAGWPVERVGRVNRGYLVWCLAAVPLRGEVRRTILRVLAKICTSGCKPGAAFTRTRQGAGL